MAKDISIVGDQKIRLPVIGHLNQIEFDPNSIAGLQLWVDGDYVVESGGVVSEMVDRSPTTRIVSSVIDPVALVAPARNGHNGVLFNGSQRFDITPALGNASVTAFVVANVNGGLSAAYAPLIIGSNFRIVARTGSSAAWGTYVGSDVNATTVLSDGTWCVLEITSTGGGVGTRLIYNGIQEATSVGASTGTPISSFGGEDGFSRFLQGIITAILVYDSILSVEDRTKIRNYLFQRYALP